MKYKVIVNELNADLTYEHDTEKVFLAESDEDMCDTDLKYFARKVFLEEEGFTSSEGYEHHMSCYYFTNAMQSMRVLISVKSEYEPCDQVSFYHLTITKLD